MALGHDRYSSRNQGFAGRGRRSGIRQCAARRAADAHGFRPARLGPACPPKGDKPHRYIFTLHALKVDKLEVPQDATAALVGFMIHANELGKAALTAKYGRK